MYNIQIYVGLFFESIAAFMSLFFFLQYLIIRRREHLYYALYLFSLSVYYFFAIPELFIPAIKLHSDVANTLNLFKRPLQFIGSISYTLFVIHYLGLKNTSPNLYRFFRLLMILYAVFAGASLVLNVLHVNYQAIYYTINFLLLPAQFYIVLVLLKGKVPYSKYIIWGTIVILVGSLITLLISVYDSTRPALTLVQNIDIFIPVQLSILIDMFLFTLALQKKIADTEKSLVNAAYLRQQAVSLERERIIADLHDDVGGGLSSIRMMSDLMAKQITSSDATKVIPFAHKISSTAKDIAQRMHTIIWSLNAENDTMENFVEYVRQYGMNYFESSGIDFSCDIHPDLPGDLELKGVHRKNMFLIVKESFHNILKHAAASKANVSIGMLTDMFKVEVKDNGQGITNPNQFGNGLKNMKKRMEEIGGNLHIISDGGTTISFTSPLA